MELVFYADKHLDELEDLIKISKDARILDVAAGTGLIGQQVTLYFRLWSSLEIDCLDIAKYEIINYSTHDLNIELKCLGLNLP